MTRRRDPSGGQAAKAAKAAHDEVPPALLVHLEGWPQDAWLAEIRRQAPELDVRTIDALGNVEEIGAALLWRPPAGLLARLPRLRLIVSAGAGVDHLLSLPDLPADVPISRFVDPDLAQRMAEYVTQQALMHLRLQPRLTLCQRRRQWCDDLVPPRADEVTCGIMGMGQLGRAAAAMLRAVGFRVIGWRRQRRPDDGPEVLAGEGALDRFLAQTDILVCLLPLTKETEGILDLSLFRRLRRDGPLGGPVLINAGRGRLQKEADILRALEEGVLAGASLDVFETEPLPADSPLWDHPNVVVTPHIAALSMPAAVVAHALRQLERVKAGLPVEHVVDRARGY